MHYANDCSGLPLLRKNLEKSGKQKMIKGNVRDRSKRQGKAMEFVWSEEIAFTTRNLTLTITTCPKSFDNTTVYDDYWHIP
jgi:hypothetical protein